MKNKKVLVLLLVAVGCQLVVAISGCAPIAVSEDQKKQILTADPDFQKILDMKSKLDNQLISLRAEFLSEKDIYESKITALRKEYESDRAKFYAQTQDVKSKLNPEREKIKLDIAVFEEQLKNKNKGLRVIEDMLGQSKAIIENKFNSGLSEKDKLDWHKRYDSLIAESTATKQEIAKLKEKLYILKLKQRSIIQ